MLRSEAIKRIQRTLGYRTGLEDEIVDALQDAQVQLEIGTTLPWFLKEKGELTTQVNEPEVNLPADFLRLVEFEDEGPSIGTAFLQVLSRGEALRRYNKSEPSRPRVMVLRNKTVELFPPPDQIYSINFPYYKKAVKLLGDIENEWLKEASMVLIGAAGLLVAADRRNPTAITKFQSQLEIGWEAIHRENAQREVGGRQIVVGRRA